MNKITRISILTIFSVMAVPIAAFSHYSTPSNSGTNPSNQQQVYANQDQYGNQTRHDSEEQYSTHSNDNYSQQQQHPVYEYMLGKDGKWHQTTGPENHAYSPNEGRNVEPSSSQSDKINNQR
jgi:hypothetical protein